MKFVAAALRTQKDDGRIGFSEKLAYGCGGLADVGISVSMSAYLLFYYTDVAKVSAVAVGAIFFASRLLGAFFDLLIGLLVDARQSKSGKARPWILHMSLPLAVSGVLLFSSPNLPDAGKYAYIFITYTFTNFFLSSLNIPYGALNSLMTQNPYERSSLNVFRMVMSLIGTLAVNNCTLPLVKFLGDGKSSWQLAAILYGALAVLFYLFTYRFTKERVEQAKSVKKVRIPVREDFRSLLNNKYWFMLFVVAAASYVLAPVSGGIKIYYAQYVLGSRTLIGLLATANTLPRIAAMFFIAPLVKHFGKRNAVIAGLAVSAAGILLQIFNPYSISMAVAGNLLRGMGNAPITGVSMAMLADTVEYGYWKSSVHSEGILFSMTNFGKKFGSAVGSALLPLALAFSGYVAHTGTPSASAVDAIKWLYLALPLAVIVFQIAVLSRYKLDREYPEILEDLNKREAM
ncbi:MFS transporter [Faecalispora anaeroviscerum]|uniref:MFS transporter n=1 Tax=Faecalispora anaeroviscerum TaxID=2991836 RepID=UPI0024BB23D9|nr:glycoside-pentoside-hexuronide (GPH):cation symporter [Faecalispora anaeroviscerum]